MSILQKGSSMLMVLLVTSLLGIIIMSVWHTSMYNVEIAYARAQEQQRYNQACGILNYGIGFVRENFEKIKEQGNTISIPIDHLAQRETQKVPANIEIKSDGKKVHITASLLFNTTPYQIAVSITEHLDDKEKQFLVVEDFRRIQET